MNGEAYPFSKISNKATRELISVASLIVISMQPVLAVDTFTSGVSVGPASSNTVVPNSLSIGTDNDINAESSIGVGTGGYLSADTIDSGVLGKASSLHWENKATFLVGEAHNAAYQHRSFAAGHNNVLNAPAEGGFANIVLGAENVINPGTWGVGSHVYASALIGLGNKTSETQSWVIGIGNIGQTNTVTLGAFNQPVAGAALIVGNGFTDGSTEHRSNGMVVLQNGTVQIPSGNLLLGSENALTPSGATTLISSHLSTNGYLKKASGTGALVSNGGLLANGQGATASGLNSAAVGSWSNATGEGSMAFGTSNYSTGLHSFVMGVTSNATADYALALGNCANAFAREAVAMGAFAKGYSNQSLALGYNAQVTADAFSGTAIGTNSVSTNGVATAMGVNTRATAYASTALGSSNIGIGSGGWHDTDPVLEVGNAWPWGTERSNALTMLKNGRTTLTNKFWLADVITGNEINASNGEALNVEGHSVLQGDATVKGRTTLEGKTVLKGEVVLDQPQGDISMGIYN